MVRANEVDFAGDALGRSGSLNNAGGVDGITGFNHLPAHYYSAVDFENQIEIEPSSCDVGRQVRRIPAPELTGTAGDMGS